MKSAPDPQTNDPIQSTLLRQRTLNCVTF